jgi:2'-5' RNA ligase
MSGHSIRIFLAVAVPDDVRAAIDTAIAPLRDRHPRVRWVRPELWHFTLIFLGERTPTEVAVVEGVATAVCRGADPYLLEVRGSGSFPNAVRPRVLWIGAGTGVDALAGLRDRLFVALRDGGVSMPNEKFSAHLTVARVRDDTTPEGRAEVGRLWSTMIVPPLAPFEVRAAHLMRSDLSPSGPRYTSLAAFSLAAGNG